MRDWLTARPVAHRGLHDAAAGIVENSASAFRAAIAGNYAIECDVQISADGEAMVHHDDALGRLNEGSERLDTMTAAALRQVAFRTTADRMLTLGELCDLVAGKVTLVVEMKCRFDGNLHIARRTASVLSSYVGPAAAMSFDPALVAALREAAPGIVRGLVAQNRDGASRGVSMPGYVRRALAAHIEFLAYRVQDLPSTVPTIARRALGLPLLTWTVRSAEDRARASRYADQIIFEGFRP
ncbi:MAG: glycerophosphodiester phosphodiesterase [Alphaproteobacteria bacterium]|nr:glycerophosphodiester phosphodiesterase [Alphaproteobacteria bacterium]